MTKAIIAIFDYLRQHRMLMLVSLLVLTVALALLVMRQSYKEDISDFLPLNNKYQQAMKVYQDYSGADRVIAIFECGDSANALPDTVVAAISHFEQRLGERDTAGMASSLTTQIDTEQFAQVAEFVYSNIPYFLTEADYARFDSLLSDGNYIAEQLEADKQMLLFPVSGLLAENMQRDPLNLFTPAVARLQGSQPAVNYELYDGYFFSDDMTRAFATMTSPYGASETEHNAQLLTLLEQVAAETMAAHPQVDVRFVGGPVIAVANSSQIKHDSLLSLLVAVTLILALLFWVFRNVRNLLLIAVSIAWGWLFAMGLLTVFHNELSVIVIGISSVIVGIAVNYPLHLIAHLRHTADVKSALKEIVMPLVVGNVTTVGAFLALVPLRSVALRDLGAFAALLLVGTIVFVLIYLPHLTARRTTNARLPLLDTVSDLSLENHRWLTIAVVALTIVFAYFSLNTSFDANMSHINYMTAQQRDDMAYFQRIAEQDSAVATVYMVASDTTPEGALAKSAAGRPALEQMQRSGTVGNFSSVGSLVVTGDEQRRRLDRWNDFVAKYGAQLKQQVAANAAMQGFANGSFDNFNTLIDTHFDAQPIQFFEPVTSTVCARQMVTDSVAGLCHVIDAVTVADASTISDVEQKLEHNLPGAMVFDVTTTNSSIATNLSDDFNYIGWACALIVFFFLWFSLGSIELALLSFLPMAISWVWILGIMSLLGIQFNVVNVILATFIFGQGDDYTIFMTEGCQYEYAYGRKMLASYKGSIIVSALLMFIGIGSLIFAKHPALHSLAQVTIVGMFSVVLMAYLFPPLIFKWLVTLRGRERRRPVTLMPLLRGLGGLAPALFGVRHITGVSFNLLTDSGEAFDKPAVVACDHNSALDLAVLRALPCKLVIADDGKLLCGALAKKLMRLRFVEAQTDTLVELMRQGCSVAVLGNNDFAKKVATAVQADVLPLVLHGTDMVMPPQSACLYAGRVTAEVGERVAADADVAAVLHKCSEQRRRAEESTAYFRQYVLDHYRYRGIEIYREVKKRLKRYGNYSEWLDADNSPDAAVIVNCGWGECAMLMSLLNPEMHILAVERDADKAAVAQQCMSSRSGVTVEGDEAMIGDFVARHSGAVVYLVEPTSAQLLDYEQYNTIIINK